ncbi:MAG: hypothetical protein AB199_03180 [Parcubacteria bacterium C7867-004]|nr:MAG: hypothetical protein AB199_03180 [Parcubacteria bacterium C7867-004]
MTIPDPVGRSKALLGRIPADVVIIGVLALSSSAAFGLGFITGKDTAKQGAGSDLWIEQLPQSVKSGGGPAAAIMATVPTKPAPAVPEGPKVYVASKNGTKYYLPSCGSVKRIKEENKVWFATKEEAAAAGYEPSATCKGL